MDESDLRLRNLTYGLFVELGRAPTADPDGEPFSAVPTPHRVNARGRWWYGNCAWDAFGICAALDTDGRIETNCADYGDELAFDVRDGRPHDQSLVFHCLVPAAHWWDDIVHT